MNSKKFREELRKIMPGYKWVVHRRLYKNDPLKATGIQSRGYNRTATLQVVRRDRDGRITYEVKSAGFGARSPWLGTNTDRTLTRALRGLQSQHEHMAREYGNQASCMQYARARQ
jgi:hypothetical protein